MTDFLRARNLAPGEGIGPKAPLRKVTRLAEADSVLLSEIQGNPDDAGIAWPLIARYVNGAEEFDFGVYKLEADRFVPAEVSIGHVSLSRVVIERGLQPGDRIALRDPSRAASEIVAGPVTPGGQPVQSGKGQR